MLIDGSDLHPPFTHWLSHLWLSLFGESEWALRSIWAFVGVLILALTYRLGATLSSRSTGLLGATLLATLSTFLLYTRFVKYYAFAMLMAVALFLVFFRIYYQRMKRLLAVYVILLTAFLYADYFGPAACVLWQDLFLFIRSLRHRTRREWSFLLLVVGAQALAGLLWIPWVNYAFLQTHRVFSMKDADIGRGFFSFALKIAHAFYSFSLGETLFPWQLAALLGLAGALGALMAAVIVAYRNSCRLALWMGSFSLFSISLVAGLTSSLITGVPFIAFANHVIFTLPFFLLWLSSGIVALRPLFKWLLISSFLIAHVVGLVNYFTGREFHNPIYVVPTREIVTCLAEEVGQEEVVIAADDTGIAFYASRTAGWTAPVFSASDKPAIEEFLRTKQPPRVWLFIFGRDRTRAVTPTALQEWIEGRYLLVELRGYAEQDAVYRRIKELLFRRPAYLHKLTLYVYESL
ncbi:MAG: glycosyltransferase family 39 protein [Anaerolineae bacterium]